MHPAPFGVATLLLIVSASAQSAYHFEFDQVGVLPSATPDVAAGNNSGTATTTLFGVTCGVLQQRTSINPTLGAFFYSGSFPGYATSGPGLTPNLDTFLEARFRQVGGTGGPGTVWDSTAVFGIYPGNWTNMVANVVTGEVGMSTAGGLLWTMPSGGTTVPHTYRLDLLFTGGITYCLLSIDGVVALGPAVASPPAALNGWFFGDGAGSNYISQDLDWEYVSIGQVAGGAGQANSYQASLFVNRDNATLPGMLGVRGPFAEVAASGSIVTLEWNGPPGAPYAMFAGTQSPGSMIFGCSGQADLAFPVTLIFDPLSSLPGYTFLLDSCGYAKQMFAVPTLPPGTSLMDIQGLIFQPSGCPFVLTAAHHLTT